MLAATPEEAMLRPTRPLSYGIASTSGSVLDSINRCTLIMLYDFRAALSSIRNSNTKIKVVDKGFASSPDPIAGVEALHASVVRLDEGNGWNGPRKIAQDGSYLTQG
ncbi:hypothetical protein OUZ56_017159 [Daphnia magna]|uniref:Uncharacterized protein n=1 Tax=Daphnia magna TaxID=35525 RepID=A0ABR0ASB7_9CRUS|nr:hypothetical protein OUZ56_017159 [Daphnia magna]